MLHQRNYLVNNQSASSFNTSTPFLSYLRYEQVVWLPQTIHCRASYSKVNEFKMAWVVGYDSSYCSDSTSTVWAVAQINWEKPSEWRDVVAMGRWATYQAAIISRLSAVFLNPGITSRASMTNNAVEANMNRYLFTLKYGTHGSALCCR